MPDGLDKRVSLLVASEWRTQAAGVTAVGRAAADRKELAIARDQELAPSRGQHRLDQDPPPVPSCGVEALDRAEQVVFMAAAGHVESLVDDGGRAAPARLQHRRGDRHDSRRAQPCPAAGSAGSASVSVRSQSSKIGRWRGHMSATPERLRQARAEDRRISCQRGRRRRQPGLHHGFVAPWIHAQLI